MRRSYRLRANLPAVVSLVVSFAPWAARGAETAIDYRTAMRWTGVSVALPDSVRSIAVNGPIAYAAAENAGLSILDVSNIDAPVLLTTFSLPGFGDATDVVYRDGFAYVAVGFDGLAAVDVANPSAPALTSLQALDGALLGLAVTETRLMGALARNGPDGRLVTFDLLGSPAFPREIGRVPTPRRAFQVIARDRLAYVADVVCFEVIGCTAGLGVYRINAGDPSELGYRGTGPIDSFDLSGRYAHVVSSSDFGYRIYDVSSPSAMQLVSGFTSLEARDVVVDGSRDLAFLTCGGVDVVDVADPLEPEIIGRVPTPPNVDAHGVTLLGSHLLVSDGRRVSIVDGAHDAPAQLAGRVDTPGFAHDVATSGSLGLVADDASCRIYDLAAPGAPVFLGSLPGAFVAIAVHGDVAHVLGPDTLTCVDVSVPASPSILGSIVAPGTPLSIDVTGDGRYAVASYLREKATGGNVRIFDVGTPSAPSLAGALEVGTNREAVEVHAGGGAVYVSAGDLHEYDISDPSNPVASGVYHAAGDVSGFTTAGPHGFAVSNASDRSFVTSYVLGQSGPVTTLEIPGPAEAGAVLDDVLYVASGASGVNVVDVQNPSRLVYLGAVDTPGDARRIATIGDAALLVADGSAGLAVAARQLPGSTLSVDAAAAAPIARRLGLPVPNPLTGSSRLPLALGSDAVVDLDVFDAAGRRVRRLLGGAPLARGAHAVDWDGADDAGRPVAAGSYFARLSVSGETTSRRIVVVR